MGRGRGRPRDGSQDEGSDEDGLGEKLRPQIGYTHSVKWGGDEVSQQQRREVNILFSRKEGTGGGGKIFGVADNTSS